MIRAEIRAISEHNPLTDHVACGLCATAMRLTFVEMADIPGAPMNTIQLVERMREIADRKVQLLRRNADYNFMWEIPSKMGPDDVIYPGRTVTFTDE